MKPCIKWVISWALISGAFALSAQSRIAYLNSKLNNHPINQEVRGTGIVSIPFQLVRNMVIVEAKVDGKSGSFLLDTGAPGLVLNQPQPGEQSIPVISLNGAMQIGQLEVMDFQWRETIWPRLNALAMDLNMLDKASGIQLKGIIGYDLIKDTELLFDPGRRLILLLNPRRHKLRALEAPLASIPLRFMDHLPVIELEINGLKLLFGIDTGAGSSLLDEQAYNILRPDLLEAGMDEQIQGLNQQTQSGKRLIVENITLGQYSLDNQVFTTADLKYLQQHDPQIRISGILGMNILKQYKFSINFQERSFHLWQSAN